MFYDDTDQPIPRLHCQDPEPERTPEQEHATAHAVEFDDRLVFTAPFVGFQSEGAIVGYGSIMSDRIDTGGNLISLRAPDRRCRFLLRTRWYGRAALSAN